MISLTDLTIRQQELENKLKTLDLNHYEKSEIEKELLDVSNRIEQWGTNPDILHRIV